MKKILVAILCTLYFVPLSLSQTLNVRVGNVTYLFPASQTGVMPFADGTTLTAMGKTFTLSDVDEMYVDETAVTDSTVTIAYSTSSARITVAGNIARYVSFSVSGAHVSVS